MSDDIVERLRDEKEPWFQDDPLYLTLRRRAADYIETYGAEIESLRTQVAELTKMIAEARSMPGLVKKDELIASLKAQIAELHRVP